MVVKLGLALALAVVDELDLAEALDEADAVCVLDAVAEAVVLAVAVVVVVEDAAAVVVVFAELVEDGEPLSLPASEPEHAATATEVAKKTTARLAKGIRLSSAPA
ncbi:MAG: hypothetical protein U0271_17725 [Polyangiaceae bacterium]